MAAGALGWPWLAKRSPVLAGWLAAAAPMGIFAWLAGQADRIARGDLPEWSGSWVPQLGVTLDFRIDGPSLLLSLLVAGIGPLILIYGAAYLRESPLTPRFLGLVQLFMLAMLGVAGSDHLLALFVFWELTSIVSYFLIGLPHEDSAARKAALRALLVTASGGVALLAGILLLSAAGGTSSIAELQQRGDLIRSHPHYPAILALVLIGAFTKSAQIPFHFWLPDAMAAPAPVSAYLHSATMVKAGVFLLAKLLPVLGGTMMWQGVLTTVGAATMMLGAVFALGQTDLKKLLAYSTVSTLGTLVMFLGIGTVGTVQAAMLLLVVHALYKAPLFMIAGVLDKATGTGDITRLQGLGGRLPLVACAAVLAALSMSGLPPSIGFFGKEQIYNAVLQSGGWAILITLMTFAANSIHVAVAWNVGVAPFRRRVGIAELDIYPKACSPSLLLGPLVLAVVGVVAGMFPGALGRGLIDAAVRDVVGTGPPLKLWHGFDPVLLLSAATVGAGIWLYLTRDKARSFVNRWLALLPATASSIFDGGLNRFIASAGAITRFFQHGNLRLYLAGILVSLAALVAASLVGTGWAGIPQSGPIRFLPAGLSLLMVPASIVAIRSRDTVMAVVAMGGVGYGVALLFASFGAPDLALTQMLVETLTLVLFALVMRDLPEIRLTSPRRRRMIDLVIALAAGIAVTVALLAARGAPASEADRASADMVARSLPEAHGKNVVNVILVDFRALDTLGEICVLAIAGLGVAGLLLGPRQRDRSAERSVVTPLFRTAAGGLAPLMLFLSVILLLRGHHEPGGGFIGGLVAGAGLVLRKMALGDRAARSGGRTFALIAGGLAIALASTLPSLLLGRPFMQGEWWGTLWLPLVGKTGVGSPFLFDVGVYAVVTGVSLLILTRLMRGSPRQHHLS